MLIHCVHLNRRADREELFRKEATEQGFQFQFHEPIQNLLTQVSLRLTMQEIVRQNINEPEICIAEDDVHFCDLGAYDYFLKSKPESYDVYISGFYDGDMNMETKRIIRSWSGLHCILIHNRFYEKFLSCDTEDHIDRWLFNQNTEVYCSYPFAAIQHVTYSDIQHRDADHSWYLLRREMFKYETKIQNPMDLIPVSHEPVTP